MPKKTFSLFLVISCITSSYIYPVLIDNQSRGYVILDDSDGKIITLQSGQKYRDDAMTACVFVKKTNSELHSHLSKTTILTFNRHDGTCRNDHYSSWLHRLLSPGLYKGYAESLKDIDAVPNKVISN